MHNKFDNNLFYIPKKLTSPNLRLFCFPFAGGSATAFHPWTSSLPVGVELCAIQLPGRGMRFKDKPYVRMGDLITDLENSISCLLDKPFIFYGHSMGSIIVFELIRKMIENNRSMPKHIVVSGRRAPQIGYNEPQIHKLSESDFIAKLKEYNGTPQEIYENKELLDLVLPILRTDFEMLETWEYIEKDPFSIPLSVCGGVEDDRAPRDMLEAWGAHTTASFDCQMFKGGHFFLETDKEEFLKYLFSKF